MRYIPIKNAIPVYRKTDESGKDLFDVVSKEDFTNEHAKIVLDHAESIGIDRNAYAQRLFNVVSEGNQTVLFVDPVTDPVTDPIAPTGSGSENPAPPLSPVEETEEEKFKREFAELEKAEQTKETK